MADVADAHGLRVQPLSETSGRSAGTSFGTDQAPDDLAQTFYEADRPGRRRKRPLWVEGSRRLVPPGTPRQPRKPPAGIWSWRSTCAAWPTIRGSGGTATAGSLPG